MIYVTGDTHGDFSRLIHDERLTEEDKVIVCGDFGLLWSRTLKFVNNIKELERLPFQILWVQGNHENYNMIKEYKIEEWNGGKVRHIIKDKVILLERGQVFNIEGRTFFTFGGASSHDIQGGLVNPYAEDALEQEMRAIKSMMPYRIIDVSWWEEELPNENEMEEGIKNLEKVGYQVDYVITHCLSTNVQERLERQITRYYTGTFVPDKLTDYFEKLESKLRYKVWFCGHYHMNYTIDEKHMVLYKMMETIEDLMEGMELDLGLKEV